MNGQEFKGERGWQNLFMLSIYAFTFIFMFVPNPMWVIIGAVVYSSCFGWLNAKAKLKKKEEIEGIQYLDCLVVKDKQYSEPMLIGVLNHSELKLTEVDIEDTELYQQSLAKYNTEINTKDRFLDLLDIISSKSPFDTKRETKKKTAKKKNILKNLRDMNQIPEKTSPPGEKKSEKKILSQDEINKTAKIIADQTLQILGNTPPDKIKKPEQREISALELAIKEGEKEDPDLDVIIDGIPIQKPDFPLDYPLVRAGFRAYDIINSEEIAFADQSHESHKFKKMVLITNTSYEESFHFSTLPLWVDGYFVKGKAGRCALAIIDWIDVNYPLMMLVWSEKETIDNIDYQIDAKKIRTLREKVMQRIIYQYINYFKRFELQIEELTTWNDSFYENWQMAIQYLYHHKAEILESPADQEVDPGMIKVNKMVLISLITWSFLSLVIIGIMVIFVLVGNNPSVPLV